MRTIRLTWPAEAEPGPIGREQFLTADQARHGAVVLRLAPGDKVELVSSAGVAPATVTTVDKKTPRLGVATDGPWVRQSRPGPRLALALIQHQRFDWAVEKAVELGAAELIPLITERVKSGDARPGQIRRERWQRLAEEARKQCGRSTALEIFPPLTLAELAAQPGPGLFLSPAGAAGMPTETAGSPLLAVGPEGGFSPAEEKFLIEAHFKPWGLGPKILRAETAALAALAIIMGHSI